MTIKELNNLCEEIKKTPNFPFPIEEWPIVTQRKYVERNEWCSIVFLNVPQKDTLRVVYCNMLKGGVLMRDTLTVEDYMVANNRELGMVEDEIVKNTGVSIYDLIDAIRLL